MDAQRVQALICQSPQITRVQLDLIVQWGSGVPSQLPIQANFPNGLGKGGSKQITSRGAEQCQRRRGAQTNVLLALSKQIGGAPIQANYLGASVINHKPKLPATAAARATRWRLAGNRRRRPTPFRHTTQTFCLFDKCNFQRFQI